MSYIAPIIIVVAANTFYNICAKQSPQNANPFACLIVTYTVAAILSAIMFFATSTQKSLIAELTKINWTTFVFGASLLALEYGYINIYKVGWKVSTASLTANIALAVILVIVGALLYKEVITPRRLIGMAICTVGLIIMGK